MTKSKFTLLLREILVEVLQENFPKSPDSDFPTNDTTKFVVFNADEKYELKGRTHGLLSHAIKHLHEFAPSEVDAAVDKATARMKHESEIYLKDGSSILSRGASVHRDLTDNVVLNTLDRINDKFGHIN